MASAVDNTMGTNYANKYAKRHRNDAREVSTESSFNKRVQIAVMICGWHETGIQPHLNFKPAIVQIAKPNKEVFHSSWDFRYTYNICFLLFQWQFSHLARLVIRYVNNIHIWYVGLFSSYSLYCTVLPYDYLWLWPIAHAMASHYR